MKNTRSLTTTILITLLLGNGVWGAAPWIPRGGNDNLVTSRPSGLPDDADYRRGLLNVKKFDPPGSVGKAKGDNTTNDTDSIQAALYASYEHNLVCYFPMGTYVVTDTLECDQAVDNNRRYTFQILGQKKIVNGNPVRPVIRLKDGSVGFGGSNPRKPILKIWGREVPISGNTHYNVYPDAEKPGDCFSNVVRGIDIWTGSNSKAAGMYFAGAQGCSVEDVTINATGGNCGFLKSIGVNGGYYNVEVLGGQYGIWIEEHNDPVYKQLTGKNRAITDQFPIFAGCRFYNQTVRVLFTKGRSPVTFAGCHFKKSNSGHMFETRVSPKGQGGNLAFFDCVIELKSYSLAIKNKYKISGIYRGKGVYLKDVYFKNASKITDTPEGVVNGNGNGWSKVTEYGRALTSIANSSGSRKGQNLINGNKNTHTPVISPTVIQTSGVSAPNVNAIMANHIWDEASFPAFDDPDVYDIVTQGGVKNDWSRDETSRIQSILNNPSYPVIFIPKGLYKFSNTLTIPGNKKVFGISRTISVFRPNFNAWNPGSEQYMIQTGTGKDDAPLLSNVWFDFRHTSSGKMLSVLHWRAGRNSMIRNIFAWDSKWGGDLAGRFTALNKKLFRFSGNAGGKIFGISISNQQTASGSAHDGARVYYITGTSEPLNIYGFNVERQLGRFQSEINNAQNVNIFGGKTEGTNPNAHLINRADRRPMIGITNNSQNIIVGTVAASINGANDGWVQIRQSNDVLCVNITSQTPLNQNLIEEFTGSNNSTTNPNHFVSAKNDQFNAVNVFKRGNATLNNFDGSPPPPPPPGGNTKPNLSPVADIIVDEGDTAIASLSATDPDGDSITLSATGLPSFATLTDNGDGTGTIQFAPVSGDAGGPASITVKADDGKPDGKHYKSFDVTVTPGANTKPNLSPINDVTLEEGGNVHVNVSAVDPDGDSLILRVYDLPGFGSFMDNGNGTGTINISPSAGDAGGPTTITVKADDGKPNGEHFKQFDLTVTPGPNNAPILSPISDVSIDEAGNAVVNISATDPDGDPITLTAIDTPTFGSLTDNGDGTGSIRFLPGYADSGTYPITAKADDGRGGLHHKAFTLTVVNVNRKPDIVAIADVTMDEGITTAVNISVIDPDGNPITLSAYNYPSAFTVFTDNGNGTGTMSFAPGFEDAGGPTLVTIKAEDGIGGTRFEQFNITVNNVNRVPLLTVDSDDVSVNENEEIVISISARDADADPITLSATDMPNFGTLIDNGDGTGSMTLSPGYSDAGILVVTLTADDGKDGIHNKGVRVTINNINRPPSIGPISHMSIEEECIHVLSLNATDPDTEDTLSFSTSGLPSFGNLANNGDGTATIVLSPAVGDAGDYENITVTVEDGNTSQNSASTSFNIRVDSVPATVAYRNDFSTGTPADDFISNTGSFEIANGELAATSEAISAYKSMYLKSVIFPDDTDNFKIVSRMKKGSANGYRGSAVRFRYGVVDGKANFNSLQIRSNADADIRLIGPTNATTIASWDVDMNPGVYHTYSITVSGTDVNVYFNNTHLGSAVISRLSGRIGLTERKDNAFWDYFRVVSIGEPDYIQDFDDSVDHAKDWVYSTDNFQFVDTGDGDFVLKQAAGKSFVYARYSAVVDVDANYSLSVDGRASGGRNKAWDSPNLLIKFKDADNFFTTYVFQDTVTGVRDLKLKKVIGNVSTETVLVSGITSLDDVAEWHTIEAQVNGNRISLWVNGVQEVSDHIDNDLTAPVFDADTECGVRTPTSGTSVEFDNFKFYDEYE